MSKLDELIQQLCPDGVEYKHLGLFISIYTGEQFNKRDMNDNGSYPVINGGILPSGYIESYNEKSNTITISQGGASAGHVAWQTTYFWAGAHCYVIKPLDDRLNNKYLYHFIKSKETYLKQMQHGAGIPALNRTKIQQIEIPLPPLPVQEEIVRILDTFTESTNNLKEQIQTRRKQYVEYRSNLLDIGMERQPLKDLIVKGYTGATPLKSKAEYYENGTIPWLRTQEVCFNDIYSTDCFITEEALNKTSVKWIPANCVIVAISGATAGRCAINKIPLTTNQHCLSLDIDKTKAIYKFVYYCMCRQNDELIGKKEGARGDLNVSKVLGLKIPCPILPEQQRIVDILDLFEASIANLEAQLKQREKQYEYYRNQLLDFKKKED